MYDIKSIEFGQKKHQEKTKSSSHKHININDTTTNVLNSFTFFDRYPVKVIETKETNSSSSLSSTSKIGCSIISFSDRSLSSLDSSSSATGSCTSLTSTNSLTEYSQMTLMSLRRRRILQRQACLLSILAAFIFGLVLGVFMPMIGFSSLFSTSSSFIRTTGSAAAATIAASRSSTSITNRSRIALGLPHPPSDFPTIYESRKIASDGVVVAPPADENLFSVSFIKEKELPAEEVFRNAFHLEQDKTAEDSMIVKKLDASDGSIKEFRVQRTSDGLFRKGPERRLSKPSVAEQVLHDPNLPGSFAVDFIPIAQQIIQNAQNHQNHGIIKNNIYWGDAVEEALPKGFTLHDSDKWNSYVKTGIVTHLEPGCGRMQNRLVVFADGTRACARYRQNTDQIQGELFSFYLGLVLNLTNLAPSAASVIDLDSPIWSSAVQDITNAQWKSARPVVLTRWLPDLEPAGIPTPFQPLERHLNKYDVWNITLGSASNNASSLVESFERSSGRSLLPSLSSSDENQKGLLKQLGAATSTDHVHQSSTKPSLLTTQNSTVLQRLIELAQWSDLIVFDYLIANLDRVVNNLYNYQWNADIMAAPAHNLARQTNSQLLVFLDNESGLLHGYRLLKKYEAYHGLLLDNLCVFRHPTIEALRQLREYGAGKRLHKFFEQTTSQEIRDVLPSLPDKSIKILIDRIDRVLGQVQKCRDLFSDR